MRWVSGSGFLSGGFSGIELEVLSGFLSECGSESTYTCIKKRGLIDSF